MKFSFNALNSFLDLNDLKSQPDKLVAKLSSSGFEVETYEKKQLNHVVTAEIKSIKAHPKADRLQICKVESQTYKTHSIVCGANNFQTGDKVALALPGATLPAGLKIKTRQIRGELSEGMLVSASEIGLTPLEEKQQGILILPQDTQNGQDFGSFSGLNDIVFDIDIMPHRADCLSHFGLSRELSCLLNRTLNEMSSTSKIKTIQVPKKQAGLFKTLSIEVRQKKLCSRYTGQAVYGVKIQTSPLWLRVYLQNLALKSINNVVDISNYCLMQWGQPLHAFDLDRLNKKIIVDFSKKGERLLTLDNQEIILTGEELCIRDEKAPIALAGVIGGKVSGIHSGTKNVFLESACFDPFHVRASSKRFHIETDSSFRFSRGIPSETTWAVGQKAVNLIEVLAGGQRAQTACDIGEKPVTPKPVEIEISHMERRLGMPVSAKKFTQWMNKLGCKVEDCSHASLAIKPSSHERVEDKERAEKKNLKVTPPFFRSDLNIREDLIEEYARLESYDKIPETPVYLSVFPSPDHREHTLFSQMAFIMAHEGFYQAINHSFISSAFSCAFLKQSFSSDLNGTGPQSLNKAPLLWQDPNKETGFFPIFLKNPLSAEYNMMRVSLIPSLFKNALKSMRHGASQGRLFEIGKVFARHDTQKKTTPSTKSPLDLPSPYREDTRLGLMAWGQKEDLWEKHQNRLCIYDLKTALSALLEKLYVFDYEWIRDTKAPAFIHPGQYIILKVQGKMQAYIGSLHPEHAEQDKVRQNMAFGEINTAFLLQKSEATRPPFKKLSSFPVVERDLSFLLPRDFPAEDIAKGLKKRAGALCSAVKVFDVYEGEQKLNKGERAVAFRLILQSDTKTLTEDTLNKLQKKLTQEITSHYPAQLRK